MNGLPSASRATLAAAHAWAAERNEDNLVAAREYQSGAGPFQHRAAQNVLIGAFLVDFYRMVAEWAEWATEQVEGWPEDPSRAVAEPALLAEVGRRAEWDRPRAPRTRRGTSGTGD